MSSLQHSNNWITHASAPFGSPLVQVTRVTIEMPQDMCISNYYYYYYYYSYQHYFNHYHYYYHYNYTDQRF